MNDSESDIIPDTFFYIFLAVVLPLFFIIVIWILWRVPC